MRRQKRDEKNEKATRAGVWRIKRKQMFHNFTDENKQTMNFKLEKQTINKKRRKNCLPVFRNANHHNLK